MKNKSMLISVFSSNNYALFILAKSILTENEIEYYSSGDHLINLETSYPCEIKVFEKDESISRKLLSKLEENKFYYPDKFNKKSQPYIGYLVIGIIVGVIMAMVIVFSLIRN